MIVLPEHVTEYYFIKAKDWKLQKAKNKVVFITYVEAKNSAETNGLYSKGFEIIFYDNGKETVKFDSNKKTKQKKVEKTKYDISRAIKLIKEDLNWNDIDTRHILRDHCYLGFAIYLKVNKSDMSRMKEIGLREKYFIKVEPLTGYYSNTLTPMTVQDHLDKYEELSFVCTLNDKFIKTKEPKAVEFEDLF